MPWCPECRTEYREEFDTCSDCGTKLVDELEPLREEQVDYDREAFLMSVSNDIEARLVESLLESYKIPVMRKYRDSGAFMQIYMGMSNCGIDLFVPSRLLEKAGEIACSKPQMEEMPQEGVNENSFIEQEYNYTDKRRSRTRLILLIFVIPGILGVIVLFVKKLQEIFINIF